MVCLLAWLESIKIELNGIVALAIIIGLFALTVVVRDKKIMNDGGPFDTISAFVYIRLDLAVQVSLSEAGRVSKLFVPNYTGTWWPMKEVRKISKEYRKDIFAKKTQYIMNTYFDSEFEFYEAK